ncbi:hypothetical protein MRX96_056282 [Rhipicephalus microplus]
MYDSTMRRPALVALVTRRLRAPNVCGPGERAYTVGSGLSTDRLSPSASFFTRYLVPRALWVHSSRTSGASLRHAVRALLPAMRG